MARVRSLRSIDSISGSSAARASRKLHGEEEISSRLSLGALISGFDVDYGPRALSLPLSFKGLSARYKAETPRARGGARTEESTVQGSDEVCLEDEGKKRRRDDTRRE